MDEISQVDYPLTFHSEQDDQSSSHMVKIWAARILVLYTVQEFVAIYKVFSIITTEKKV